MKRTAILILSGVLVLLGAVVVLPSFIDWNRYRADVAGMLETALGRDVRLGALSFRLLPQPTLRAADVTVANVPGGKSPYFARLQALDVRVGVLPLLRGTLNIRSLGLVAPHLVLETLPDGRNNWTFGRGGNVEDRGGTDVQIDALTIDDGRLDYRNLGTGRTVSLTALNAALTAESLSGPFSGDGTVAYADTPMAFEFSTGRLADEDRPVPVMAAVRLSESGGGAAFSGRLTRLAEGARASGALTIDGENLNRAAQDIARMTDAAVPPLPAAPFAVTATIKAGPDEGVVDPLTLAIDGERLEGRARVGRAGETAELEIDLAATRFDLDKLLAAVPDTANESDDREAPPGDFSLPGTVMADISLSANAIDLRDDIIRRVRLDLSLTDGTVRITRAGGLFPGGMDMAASGTLQPAEGRPRFTGPLELGARNLRQFLTWAGVDVADVPAGRLAQFDFQADVTLTPQQMQVDGLAMSLDGTDVTGRLGLSIRETPRLTADLSLDRLPVDAYVPPPDPEAGPIDLTPLAGLAADMAITADRLSFGDTVLNDVMADFQLADGTLDIAALEIGTWAGARIGATGRIDDLAGMPAADLKLTAEGESADRVMGALGVTRPPDRPPLGDFNLTGRFQGNRDSASVDFDGRLGTTQLRVGTTIDRSRPAPHLALDFRAENPSFSALAGQMGLDLAPAADSGTVPATLSGTLTGTAGEGKGDLHLDLAGGRFDLAGQYAAGGEGMTYDFELSGTQPEPRRLAQALGFAYRPAGSLGPMDVDLAVTGAPETVRMDRLHLALGEMRIDGSAAIDLSGDKPAVTAKLDGTAIDLNALLPPADTGLRQAQAADRASTAAKARARWSRDAIDWSGLNAFDAEIEITADALRYATYRFAEPSFSLSLKDGGLELAPVSARLFDGRAAMGITMAAGPPPRLGVDIDLDSVSVESFLAATAGNPAATGTADLTGTFSGSGDTQYDMIRSLTGEAQFAARNGVIRKIDLPRLSERLNTLTRMQDFLSLADTALSGGETPYRSLTGTVTMENGIARTTDTKADIEAGEATLTATLDLPAWSIDGRGVFRLTEVPGAPPITVDVTGPIDNPDRRVNTQDLRNFVAGRVGAAALKRALGDRERNGLGDLLGRPGTETPAENGTPQQPEEATPLERLLKGLERLKEPADR